MAPIAAHLNAELILVVTVRLPPHLLVLANTPPETVRCQTNLTNESKRKGDSKEKRLAWQQFPFASVAELNLK